MIYIGPLWWVGEWLCQIIGCSGWFKIWQRWIEKESKWEEELSKTSKYTDSCVVHCIYIPPTCPVFPVFPVTCPVFLHFFFLSCIVLFLWVWPVLSCILSDNLSVLCIWCQKLLLMYIYSFNIVSFVFYLRQTNSTFFSNHGGSHGHMATWPLVLRFWVCSNPLHILCGNQKPFHTDTKSRRYNITQVGVCTL